MKIPKYLTQIEFDTTIACMQISVRTRDIAHSVLVKRYTVRAVASEYQITFQRVWQLAQRVYQVYMDMQETPDKWELVKVYLPEKHAKKVRKMASELRAKALTKLIKSKRSNK